MNLVCKCCRHSFDRAKRRKFCSTDCFHVWSRGRINKGPKSAGHCVKLSQAQKGKPRTSEAFLSPDRRRKISIARKGMKFSASHRQALSEAKVRYLQAGGFHGKQSEYVSMKTSERSWAHSGFELELMKQLDASLDVVRWTKNHGIWISYVHNGSRFYVPDFLIEARDDLVIVMEAKGYEFEPARCAAKVCAAEMYCADRGWTYQVIYQSPSRVREG